MEYEKVVKEARKTIEAYLQGDDYTPKISERAGIFVTLYNGEELRGCIGVVKSGPLSENLKIAAEEATHDSRFDPVRLEEMGEITIEVSILAEPRRVNDRNEVEVGKHGIIIRKGFSSGLLLPQVAVEHGMNRDQFLEAGCRKAGITDGRGAEIWVFEARVFRETEPNGPVVEKDLNR
jgi:uncharacterized protein (TIGR00296 family)